MKKDLESKLFEKYPKIFKKDESIDRNLMSFGFECGDGWYWLIDQLCSCLQHHVDYNDYPQVEVAQVKEKFGGLRFYASGADDYLRGHIAFAESLSMSICETCGSIDDVSQTDDGGWIRTRCQKCLE